MPVRRMSDTIINKLAKRYGIEIRWVPAMSIPRRFGGPMGQGCDPKRRVLYFENDKFHEGAVEHYLHELVHCIVQAPWRSWSITKTPEELLLFQFERALADATLEAWACEQVRDWQSETGIWIAGRYPGDLCLGDLAGYAEEPFWSYGYALCRRLGLLDARNRPTFQWPDWDRIAPLKDAIMKHFHTKAQSPLPPLP